MAFDEELGDRIRQALASRRGVVEKKMFGGIGFMLGGNMVAGVHGAELIVRASAEDHDKFVKELGARTFDLSRGPMKGWLLIGPTGTKGAGLKKWIARSEKFVSTLPAKAAKATVGRRVRR